MKQDFCKHIVILYVEDEECVRNGYTKTLQRYSKSLYTAKDGIEGLELYRTVKPDLVITDIKMPKMSGIEMVKQIKCINPFQAIFFTTAHTESGYMLEAIELQADAYLLKPIDKEALKSKITSVAKRIFLEKEHEKEQRIVQQILDNQSGLVTLGDLESITYASKSFLDFFGEMSVDSFNATYHPFTLLFEPYLDYISGEDKASFLASYEHQMPKNRLVLLSSKAGKKSFMITLDRLKDGWEGFFIISLSDITSLQEERMKAIGESLHDPLTGVHNRRYFERQLNEFLPQNKLNKPSLFCIAIFDLDKFKMINDAFGHVVGDNVLIAIATCTQSVIRKNDVFARWGGEEFIIIFSEMGLEDARIKCEALKQRIANLHHEVHITVTVSFGVTQCAPNDDAKSLIERADKALYMAKNSGRDKVVTL